MNSPLPILLIVALAILSGWRDIDYNRHTVQSTTPPFVERTSPCTMPDGNIDSFCVSRQETRELLRAQRAVGGS